MSQRIVVTDAGVEVIHSDDVRGVAWSDVLPWNDLASAAVYAIELPPDGRRWVAMDLDYPNGEYVTVAQDAVGFDQALTELCRRAGVAVPDEVNPEQPVEIWPAPA
jgi:hypothetical protein